MQVSSGTQVPVRTPPARTQYVSRLFRSDRVFAIDGACCAGVGGRLPKIVGFQLSYYNLDLSFCLSVASFASFGWIQSYQKLITLFISF